MKVIIVYQIVVITSGNTTQMEKRREEFVKIVCLVANTAKARKFVLDVKNHSHSIKELVMQIVWI